MGDILGDGHMFNMNAPKQLIEDNQLDRLILIIGLIIIILQGVF